MRVLVAIALLSVASALPTPDVPATFNFRSLFAPKDTEVSQDSGATVHFVDSPKEQDLASDNNVEAIAEDDNVVQILDTPTNEEANNGVAVNFVDSPVEAMADVVNIARLADNEVDGAAVNFVDSPVEAMADVVNIARLADNEVDGAAVNFVDSPVEQADDGTAVRFVDNVEAVADDGAVSAFADMPANDEIQQDGIAVNFVDSPINKIFDAADVILIGHVFEPISVSELETINVVDLPRDLENVHYPGKIYNNPMLR